MTPIKCFSLVDREVERLFNQRSARHGEYCENPVTRAGYIHGEDPIEPQKEEARRALFNREWFAMYGPGDLQPLPISPEEWDPLRGRDLLHYVFALYARSLDGKDPREHPTFEDYASGVLWEAEHGSGRIPGGDQREELKKRFPPRKLAGMGPGLSWLPPELYKEWRADCRRRSKRAALVRKLTKQSDKKSMSHDSFTDESVIIPESVRRAAAEISASRNST
jgi:hypothetical protein